MEAQAADLERREHGHSVPTGATPGHARAGEQVTQHARRLVQIDLLVEHGQRLQAGGCIASLVSGLLLEHGRDGRREELGPLAPGRALRRIAARLHERVDRGLQSAHGRQTAPGRVGLARDLVFVVFTSSGAPRLEVLQPPLEAAPAARETARPLPGPGHHAGLPGLVQPQGRLPRFAAGAQRPGGQQVDDRPPGERFAGRRRQAVGEPHQEARARRPVRHAARHRQAGLAQRGGGELDRVSVRDDQSAVPGGRPGLDGAEDGADRLAQLGALV